MGLVLFFFFFWVCGFVNLDLLIYKGGNEREFELDSIRERVPKYVEIGVSVCHAGHGWPT